MASRAAYTAAVALLVVLSAVGAPVVSALDGTEENATTENATETADATPASTPTTETAPSTETATPAGATPTDGDAGTATEAPTTVDSTTAAATERPRSESAGRDAEREAARAKVDPELLARSGDGDGSAAVSAHGLDTEAATEDATEYAVVVELDAERVAAGRDAAARVLGRDAATHGRYVGATATREEILELAAEPSVSYVREPARPVSFAGSDGTTEAVQTARLESLHARGYGGENVTVAVIDVDRFDLDNPALADRVVATKDFTGNGLDGDSGDGEHGTATAELVAETAPNASLVLVRISTDWDFYQAVDWLEAETDADVVSMSLGWYNLGPLDGTSKMDRVINASAANGTSWVVSAGNSAGGHHWGGTWNDTDGDDLMNFEDGEEYLAVEGSGTDLLWAQWDDWEDGTEDYDVCVYTDPDVANATPYDGTCTGTSQNPTERSALDFSAHDTYYLAIERVNATRPVRFDVFLGGRAEFRNGGVDAGSLSNPATNPNVVTVGAYDQENGKLESYSSRGPTVDGRLKPDVVAADNVRSSVYGNFRGTSASAPHAAGVLATLLDANRRLTPAQLKANLTAHARLVGDGPDNETGYGKVDAAAAVAGLGTYDLPPDGRLTYDGDYRLDTGGSAAPSSLVVDAADVTIDGEGRTFAAGEDGAAFATTANATNLSVRDLTVTDGPVGVAATDLQTLELANVTATTDTALSVSNVSAVTLTNVSSADAPSFDLAGENVGLSLAGTDARAPPNRGRLSAAPTLTFASSNVTVTLRYDESYANESTAAVWTDANGTWTEMNASVDTAANAVTFTTSANGTYGVYAVGDPAVDAPKTLSMAADVDDAATADANLTNVGRGNLTVVSATLSGPDAAQFSLADAPDNETVRPRATLGVRVRYAPNESGDHAATVTVRTAEVGALNVSLDGTASVPEPEPAPESGSDETGDAGGSAGGSGGGSGGGGGGAPAPAPAPTPSPTPTPTPAPTPAPSETETPTPGTRTPNEAVPHTTEPGTSDESGAATTESVTAASTAEQGEAAEAETPAAVTGTGVPGFSPVTAAVALAAAAALLARRE